MFELRQLPSVCADALLGDISGQQVTGGKTADQEQPATAAA